MKKGEFDEYFRINLSVKSSFGVHCSISRTDFAGVRLEIWAMEFEDLILFTLSACAIVRNFSSLFLNKGTD